MPAVSLEHVLRTLQPDAEVRFSLSDFPVDELLLVLHETRFTGTVELGRPPDLDRIIFREGKVLDVAPQRFLHVEMLTGILRERGSIQSDSLRAVIEEDANLDGALLGRRLVARGLLSLDELRHANHELSRRRLFQLYDHGGDPAVVRQGLPNDTPPDAFVVDLLPAVSYGIVARANPNRRQAMLAFAANKRVRLVNDYDLERNRLGLPPPLAQAARHLNAAGYLFGGMPFLPGLNPDTTAGVLLLFQRFGLLVYGESIRSSTPPTAP